MFFLVNIYDKLNIQTNVSSKGYRRCNKKDESLRSPIIFSEDMNFIGTLSARLYPLLCTVICIILRRNRRSNCCYGGKYSEVAIDIPGHSVLSSAISSQSIRHEYHIPAI
jgi:hypothetical protein